MYTIQLTKEEMEGLAGLIDAGVRNVGVRGAKIAAQLMDKLQIAIDAPVEKKE